LAGNGHSGYADGTGAAAEFEWPTGITMDTSGNIYVADQSDHRIRTITPSGVVSTLAGNGSSGDTNGTGTAAQFYSPHDVAVDSAGTVYVADLYNALIRQITPEGVVSTLAGSGSYGYAEGTSTEAQFYSPAGVAVDSAGTVYVGDSYNDRIRQITPEGMVSTLAGSGSYGYTDGTGLTAKFKNPEGVAVDSAGNVYVADTQNHCIRRITSEGVVTTLAGSTKGYTDGIGTAAKLTWPNGVAVNSAGTVIYVTDWYNHCIRKLTRQ
jgi:sugar lactone lactonase YvrE